MKILYFFQELDTPMFQWQRKHFLEELTHHNIEIETFNPLLYSNVIEANEKLLLKVEQGGVDLFISNLGYYKMLFVDTLIAIRKHGVPTLRIAWDNLMIPFIDEVLSPHFDLVWLTSIDTQNLYKKWGANTFFAPYAANPYTFTYKKPQTLTRHACFIGTPHGSRAIMINSLTENGLIVDLYYGKNNARINKNNEIRVNYNMIVPSTMETILNRFKFVEGRKLLLGSLMNKIEGQTSVLKNNCFNQYFGLSHEDMVNTYSSTVLSLSSSSAGHTDVLRNPLKIVNLRNFEIPMCGGIQICKYSDELATYYEEGKEIVLYVTDDELIDKARYYIDKATDEELFRIKEAAREKSEREHTWWMRFKLVFDILGLQYDKNS